MVKNIATPIKNFIDATNNKNNNDFINQFTTDAEITDWGSHYRGKAGVLAWNSSDNIGADAQMEFISAQAITRDQQHGQAINVNVKSKKFNGTGLIQFYLRDNLIERIIIEP